MWEIIGTIVLWYFIGIVVFFALTYIANKYSSLPDLHTSVEEFLEICMLSWLMVIIFIAAVVLEYVDHIKISDTVRKWYETEKNKND